MSNTAVIGGTGLNRLAQMELLREHSVTTPYGDPSTPVREGRFAGERVFFLPRHGTPHHLPPHRINYRANLWALRKLGVERVVAINAVGGVTSELGPGALAVPDQIVDYTWGREHTFYDGTGIYESDDGANTVGANLEHIDFTQPYTEDLRGKLLQAATRSGIQCADGATYAATQGPRLESAAEVQRLLRDGCDVVGMTGMPEAALAAELGLAYAAICLVVNAAAGLDEEPITLQAMETILEQRTAAIGEILASFLQFPG